MRGIEVNQDEYRKEIYPNIDACLKEYQCQPILFLGSGISQRFIKTPTWLSLLARLVDDNPRVDRDLSYYVQKHDNFLPAIGSELITPYFEWAWSEGKDNFPEEAFSEVKGKSYFLKYYAASIIKESNIGKQLLSLPRPLQREIKYLKSLRPHAIITTNYDQLIEQVCEDYEPYIGQKILRNNHQFVGELFKIHGCVSQPTSMILTKQDYDRFMSRQKYVIAKLLTYFAEHPVFFIGYSASDENIRAILRDVAEVLETKDNFLRNVFFVRWIDNPEQHSFGKSEELIDIGSPNGLRLKLIETSDLGWMFTILAENKPLSSVSPKTLRAFMARAYKLVRTDIPNNSLEIDFKTFDAVVEDDKELPTLLGITGLADPKDLNSQFPYNLSQVALKLGFSTWHPAKKMIDEIFDETGTHIQKSDNNFHITRKYGKSTIRTYSDRAVALLERYKTGKDYKSYLESKF